MRLRDQITSRARTVLWVLLAASILVFVIACSNVANLILARTVRREGELAIRAALGASTGALRRTLLAESLLLCGAGAALGVLSARPMVAILARYASRFSVRALDLTVDSSMLWVGAGLAIVAAVLLAFVPRLPSGGRTSHGFEPCERQRCASPAAPAAGSGSSPSRRSPRRFVLLAGASMLLKTLLALQAVQTGFDMHHVLAINVPVMSYGKTPEQIVNFYKETIRRITSLPGVDRVAVGTLFPGAMRAASAPGSSSRPTATSARRAKTIRARSSAPCRPDSSRRSAFRSSPDAISTIAIAASSEPVVIVSQSVAQRMFPEPGCGQPPLDVDRSGDEIHRRQPGAAAHRRRCRRYGR